MTLVLVVGVVLFSYACLAAVLLRFGRPWLNPAFLILVYYALNYPVRAFLLIQFPDQFNDHGLTDAEILAAIWYSSCYVLIFVGTYILLCRLLHLRFDAPATIRSGAQELRLFQLTTIVVLVSGAIALGYEVTVGGSFSLGTDIEELRRPFWVNLAGLPYSLRWFAICLGVVLWFRQRSVSVALGTAALIVFSLAEAVLSTGKGIIIAFLLLFFFLDNVLTGRAVRVSVVIFGVSVSVFFSAYSYYARYTGGTGLDSLDDYLAFGADFLEGNVLEIISDRSFSLIERMTYYLDALPLIARGASGLDAGPYAFGSLVELANLVPRVLGAFQEQYSFDRYVTQAVWGEQTFSQIFIGRIGESFFVLGFAGLLYAVIQAGIFASVAAVWTRLSRTDAGLALYFAILQGWLYQDASLTYQVKNLIVIIFCYMLAKYVARLTVPASWNAALQGR